MTSTPTPLDRLVDADAKGKLSGHQRLEMEHLLVAEQGAVEGLLAPITLARPTDMIPVAYIMHVRRTLCSGCGSEHKWSEFYALNHLRARFGMRGSPFVRNMVPVTKPEWNVPLRVIPVAARLVNACWECTDDLVDYMDTLPAPPVPEAIANGAAPAPVIVEGLDSRDTTTKAKGKKPSATLDDLLV